MMISISLGFKQKCNKFHEPIKEIEITHITENAIQVYIHDPIFPISYVEKLPFPVRVKEHATITKVVKESGKKAKENKEQLKVQPSVALVKDLIGENVEGGHIVFCEEASNIIRPFKRKVKKAGSPVISNW